MRWVALLLLSGCVAPSAVDVVSRARTEGQRGSVLAGYRLEYDSGVVVTIEAGASPTNLQGEITVSIPVHGRRKR